jgi:TonB family protein
VVWAALGTADHDAGANDVSSMKIWGDVDPDADPAIATTEASSEWLPYQSQVAVMLSAGDGVKALHARLRDDVGNVTLEVSNSIILDSTVPVVTVTTSVSRGRISKVSPYDVSAFTWTASTDVDHYEVRVVPGPGFPHGSGVLLGTAHGAENTSGGPVAAGEPVTTSITGSDLEAASPGNFPYTWYVHAVRQKIDANWTVSSGFDQRIFTQVAFTINKDGSIVRTEIEQGSGNEVFDRAAVRAVEYCNPLPPLPQGYAESDLRVHVRFTVKR